MFLTVLNDKSYTPIDCISFAFLGCVCKNFAARIPTAYVRMWLQSKESPIYPLSSLFCLRVVRAAIIVFESVSIFRFVSWGVHFTASLIAYISPIWFDCV